MLVNWSSYVIIKRKWQLMICPGSTSSSSITESSESDSLTVSKSFTNSMF